MTEWNYGVFLRNGRNRGGLAGHSNFNWVVEVVLGNTADLRRHRCREQCDLALTWSFREHALNVFSEAHTEHFVSFVKNQEANV